jgi:diguanylate cyclase (GGDEF)-like protein
MTPPPPVDVSIRRDQARDVLRGMNATLLSNLFVSFSLAGMVWPFVPHAEILGLFAVNAGINAGRGALVQVCQRTGLAISAPERVLTYCWIGALLSGLCWTVALIGLAHHGQAYTISSGLAFLSINAGAIIQNKFARAPAFAFVLPNVTILILLFILDRSFGAQIVAVNLILLTGLLLRCANEQERHYLRAKRLTYEAIALTDSLKAANVAAGQAMQRLEHSATHDHLTGLVNRAAYQAAFETCLAEAGTTAFWIMMIDLDRFKRINDRFGHVIGDAILVEAGAQLRRILGPDSVVARLGGDEFAALVPGYPDDQGGERLAQAVVLGLESLLLPSGQTLQMGASVGLAQYPRDGRTLTDLQIHADLALYAAKTGGRSTWRPFHETMGARVKARHVLERDLPEALESGAIQAWFQPQLNCSTGQVIGFEALLRWKHPALGWVSPPDAIAAAVATRRSQALTQTILRQACRMAQVLEANGHDAAVVSVNVSPNEFGTYPIADMVAAELRAHNVSATRIALEITEEAVFSNERGGKDVDALVDMGVGIIVDDFGVAYSSIGALRDLRFDSLKVDRSFIQGIVDNPQDRVLLEAVLAFARTLGVTVLAEGVETAEQFQLLRQLGCPAVQGYHFARAMPPNQALAWITGNDLVARIARQGWADGGWTIAARPALALA